MKREFYISRRSMDTKLEHIPCPHCLRFSLILQKPLMKVPSDKFLSGSVILPADDPFIRCTNCQATFSRIVIEPDGNIRYVECLKPEPVDMEISVCDTN